MPYMTPAWQQMHQETLEALDALIGAALSYRASVAADTPSLAIARQLAADAVRVVAGTGQMSALSAARQVLDPAPALP